MSYTRWIVSAKGFAIFLIGMLTIHFFSYVAGLIYAKDNTKPPVSKKYFIGFFILLALFNAGITVTSHMNKADWYGFAFYHIPSSSMEPTLYPGDVVFVDTWIEDYKQNNIITFKGAINQNIVYIKRITEITTIDDRLRFKVLGDGVKKDYTSNSFGLIYESNIIGKAEFVWFSLSGQRYLLKIR